MDYLARLLMQGVNSMLATGASRPLEMSDISSLEERERVAVVYKSFERLWADEMRLEKKNRSLARALRRTLDWKEQWWAIFLSMVAAGGACGPPLILKALSEHFSGSEVLSQSTLWILVSMLLVIPFVCSLCSAHSFVTFAHASCILRSALLPAVYNKSMELGSQSRSEFNIGQINNLFSNDINYIQSFVQQFAADIFGPGQLALALGLIYVEVGVSMFAGLVLVASLLPLLLICFGTYAKSRIKKSKIADFRMKLTNEVLSGIRILKYYAWEIPFYEKVDRIRENELGALAVMNIMMVFIILFITAIPYVMPIIIFFFFAAINGGVLDITVAFTTLSLLGLITGPIMTIPAFFQRYFQATVSLRRLQDFLQATALEKYVNRIDIAELDHNGEDAIVFENASLSWRSEEKEQADSSDAITADGDIEMVAKEAKKAPVSADNSGTVPPNGSNVAYESVDSVEEGGKISDPVNRSTNTLIDVNVRIKRGELVGVVGSVGSGKSSFLSAMLGELQLQSGSVSLMEGRIAYHAQQAWIINANVRDNILLGAPMDADRFEAAIDAASLRSDIAIFPAGLDTEIGEKGINLSGGQKARVSFARAVYRNADIYLLDDPLSAVDAHVGQHIFTNGICGALRGKTIVLVTHQVHLLDRCDKILALSNGAVLAFGTPSEVKNRVDLNALAAPPAQSEEAIEPRQRSRTNSFAESVHEEEGIAPIQRARSGSEVIDTTRDVVKSLAQAYLANHDGDGNSSDDAASIIKEIDAEDRIIASRSNSNISITANRKATASLLEVELQEAVGDALNRNEEGSARDRKNGHVSVPVDEKASDIEEQKGPKSGSLMTTEERQQGGVTWSSWKWYVGKGGWMWFILCVAVALGGAGSFQYSSFWLAEWGDETMSSYMSTGKPLSDKKNIYYLNQYAILTTSSLASVLLRTIVMVTFGLNASRKLHRRLLASVLGSPVSFFDSTPLGRLLNRFASDVATCDDSLASNIAFIMGVVSNVLGALGSIAYTTKGVFVALAAPLMYGYYRIQLYFRLTNTELKRLENISRSPIYTDFNQALIGASSLRAYGELDRFAVKLSEAVDLNSGVQIAQQLVRWWLLIRLDVIGGIVSFFVAALCAGDPTYISASYLSISLNCAFSLVSYLKRFVSVSADLEASMNSAERIKYYSDTLLSEETPELKAQYKPVVEEWPTDGRIDASNVSMAYKTGPLVLKGLNFSIAKNEKIGIAGRTGCGKSSLMASIFRIENLREGSIKIDDIDISTVALGTLRSRIGIIPQDAVMFSVTVRFNLDPFNNYSDEEIWNVLEAVEMKDAVMSFPGKLEEPVSDGGENFSMGQRQLLCIARVLLRKPKVLVMDEATASVDNETDSLIQRMIREKFKECSVLTIAHRLHTVIDSDRIMLLSDGNLIEFDNPQRLLEKTDGSFASLWKEHVQSHEAKKKKE